MAFGFVESELGYRGHLGAGPVGDCRDGDGELCIGDNQSLYVEKVVDASGSLVDAPMFRRVYAGVGIAADSGEMHSLLISEDGKVYTAGSNDFGQLCLGGTGDGDIESVDYFHEVTGIPGKAVSAAVAMRFTLILLEDGRVFGCGSNEVGQIGQGQDVNLSDKPVQVEGLENIIDLAAGLKFSVFTDGSNAYGTGGNIYLQQCKFSDGEPYFEAHQVRCIFVVANCPLLKLDSACLPWLIAFTCFLNSFQWVLGQSLRCMQAVSLRIFSTMTDKFDPADAMTRASWAMATLSIQAPTIPSSQLIWMKRLSVSDQAPAHKLSSS